MLPFIATVDFLYHSEPDEYESSLYVYVHELDRIIFAQLNTLDTPLSLYQMFCGYKKNEKILLYFQQDFIEKTDPNSKEIILTDNFSDNSKIIGTLTGFDYDEKENCNIFNLKSNNFTFKIKNTYEKNYFKVGDKILIKIESIYIDFLDDFEDKIRKIYKGLCLNTNYDKEYNSGWPNEKSPLRPFLNFNPEWTESPYAKLILEKPEYVKAKFGRSHEKNYNFFFKGIRYDETLNFINILISMGRTDYIDDTKGLPYNLISEYDEALEKKDNEYIESLSTV